MRKLALALTVLALLVGCHRRERPILLATTTSFQDTGLLDALLARFRAAGGPEVKAIAVGTGEALAMGKRGDADVLVVHAPASEQEFMAAGDGRNRRALWHNDFVLLGPAADPAGVRGLHSASDALARIAHAGAPFASRGDDSGTHKKEKALFSAAGVTPPWPGFLSTGQGMSETLRIASEKGAYVLSDRGTFLKQHDHLELAILVEGDPPLDNPYHVIEVDPGKHPGVNADGARRFADFLCAPETQAFVAGFGAAEFGRPLFVPDALGADGGPRP